MRSGNVTMKSAAIPAGTGSTSVTCTCATPQPFTRPSGTVICLNPSCGVTISTTQPTKDRP